MAFLDTLRNLPGAIGGSLQSFGKGVADTLTFGKASDPSSIFYAGDTGLETLKPFESNLAQKSGKAAGLLVGGVGTLGARAGARAGTRLLSRTFRAGPGVATRFGSTASRFGSTATRFGSRAIRAAKPLAGPAAAIGGAAGLGAGAAVLQDRLSGPQPVEQVPGQQTVPQGDIRDQRPGGRSSGGERPPGPFGDGSLFKIDPLTGQQVFSPGGFVAKGGAGGGSAVQSVGGQSVAGGGGSSFTGLLGQGGPLGSPGGLSEEEETADGGLRTSVFGRSPYLPGSLAPILGARGTSLAPQPRLDVPGAPGVSDAGAIETERRQTGSILSTGAAVSEDDRIQAMQNVLADTKARAEEMLANLPPEPIIDSPARESALESLLNEGREDEAFDLQSTADNAARELGLPQDITAREAAQAQFDSMAEAVAKFTSEIKANPDLPKGLAMRRIRALNEEFGQQMVIFQNEVARLDETIDDKNTMIDRQLGIAKDQFSMDRQARQDNFNNLHKMVSSGLIGGMTDEDIRDWAEATGVSPDALDKARDAANSVDPEDELKLQKLKNDIAIQQQKLDGNNIVDSGLSDTQRNNGALNAAMPVEQFVQLPIDIQNYYAFKSTKALDGMNEAIANVESGEEKAEDVLEEIDNSNNTSVVKTHLKDRVSEAEKSAPADEKGFLGRTWEGIKSIFN